MKKQILYDNEMNTTPTEPPKAILVAVCTDGDDTSEDFVHALEETQDLIEAADFEPVRWVTQCLPSPNPATYLGSGKLMELSEIVEQYGAEVVVTLDNISPAQLKNMTDSLDALVFDRTGLILEIFEKRAKTREAKLQVEMARLKYMLPRLVGMRKNLGRQAGTGGSLSNKGSGEKQIDLDKRRIERRMAEIRRDLKEVEHNREVQRKARQKNNIPLVSLVGYTNAGKSTIMNRLVSLSGQEEEKQVLEKDMLFATLDTTVRRISTGDRKDFLLSDTVGFISDLPHDLVSAFHSTLEEALYADLLLLVVDASDPHFKDQLSVTEETLRELKADTIPRIYVMNKIDKICEEDQTGRIMAFKPGCVSGDRIYVNARDSKGLSELLDFIKTSVYGNNEVMKVLVPYTEGAMIGRIREKAMVLKEDYREDGICFEIDTPKDLAGAIRNNEKIRIQ